MKRSSTINRKTKETDISLTINIDGEGAGKINSGIPFFDHMLTLFAAHGFFDLNISAIGDLDVDFHHTVEDIGIVLGTGLSNALGDRKGIKRFGHAVLPMDETLTNVTIDLSNRPYMVYNIPKTSYQGDKLDPSLVKEFFRAVAVNAGMNLHINVLYGENNHHIMESIFKAAGKALDQATSFDPRIKNILSTKGAL